MIERIYQFLEFHLKDKAPPPPVLPEYDLYCTISGYGCSRQRGLSYCPAASPYLNAQRHFLRKFQNSSKRLAGEIRHLFPFFHYKSFVCRSVFVRRGSNEFSAFFIRRRKPIFKYPEIGKAFPRYFRKYRSGDNSSFVVPGRLIYAYNYCKFRVIRRQKPHKSSDVFAL